MIRAIHPLFAILAAFFLSGLSALIYETIWVRLLSLIFGNTTVAVSAVLASFMAGLAAGSYISGKSFGGLSGRRLLIVFMALEALTASSAALTLPASKFLQSVALNSGILSIPYGLQSLIWFALSFPLLLIPTACMGATLPILAKWSSMYSAASNPDKHLGLLYGINTLGGAAGAALSGFMLIPALGYINTVLFAGSINFLSAAVVYFSSRLRQVRNGGLPAAAADPVYSKKEISPSAAAMLLFATGAAAMICEVAWTRAFALILGSSTYAFTAMLIAVLFGLALGSAVFSALNGRVRFNITGLSGVIALAALVLLAYLPTMNILPYVYVRLFKLTASSSAILHVTQILLCSSFIFIPAFLMGAIFPWAVRASAPDRKDISAAAGASYSANTAGNIAGSAAAGLFLISFIGIEKSLIAAVVLYALSAAACFLIAGALKMKVYARISIAGAFLLVISAGIAARPKWDPYLMNSGAFLYAPEYVGAKNFKELINYLHSFRILFVKDGLSSTVAVYQTSWGERFLRVNGKTDASTGSDVPAQMLTAYMPYLLHPGHPSSAAIIGFGSGMTTGALAVLDGVDDVDCIEIEPEVLNTAKFFSMANHNISYNPKPKYITADARHYFAASAKKYDIIASEPSNPWIAGISNLFTKESFELMRGRLNPGGIYCQWFHIYSMGEGDFKMVLNTFASVFPHVMLFMAANSDALLLGSNDEWDIDYGKITSIFNNNITVKGDLGLIGFIHPFALISNTFLLEDSDFRAYCEGAPIHRDNKPVLEFSAPHFLMKNEAAAITAGLLNAQKELYPSGLKAFDPTKSEWLSLYNISGETYLRTQQLQQAEFAFNSALKISPNDPRTNTNLARVSSLKFNHLKAEEYLKKALKYNPDYALAWFHLGMLYIEQGMEDKGLQYLEKGLRISPYDPMGCLQTAMIYEKKGRTLDAKALIRKALTVPIANRELKTRLAYMYNYLEYR